MTMATASSPAPAAPADRDREEEVLAWTWFCAVHEIGHAVGILVISAEMGIRPPAQTIIAIADRAIALEWATSSVPFCERDKAVISACGPAAESLSRRFKRPRVRPVDTTIDTTPEAVRAGETIARLETTFHVFDGHGPTDQEAVRSYCCATASGPAAWSGRWRTVHRRARQIVKANRRLIVALARELFSKGVLRNPDIERIAGTIAGTIRSSGS
jgi:hypothetical protein